MRRHSSLLAIALVSFVACKKSEANAPPASPDPGAHKPAASTTPAVVVPPAPTPTPTDTTPPEEPPAVGLASLNPDPNSLPPAQKQKFDALEQKLQSPCGKAQSLHAALGDPSCKRAPFAEKYLARLVSLDLSDDEVTDTFNNRYGKPAHDFNVKDSAFLGSPNAPVQVVEFFDYGCPHCRDKAPVLEALVAKHPHDVVVFYKNFPLSFHPDSKNCAIASVAAQRQGKFLDMHKKLFASQGAQSKDQIMGYAKDLGLDMQKFVTDFGDPAAAARVDADRAEGEKAQIQGTPTIYVNGREFTDPVTLDDLGDWVAEELAVKN